MAAKSTTITRVRVAKEELDKMSKEQLQKCWNLQDQYVDLLENKLSSSVELAELLSLRESEEKLKQQHIDSSRRENILVMRLTTKEQEMQEFAGQIQELKQAQVPTIAQLRSAMLDPAVNLLFEKMKKEVESLKARLEETQNELSAWKFTPDSNTGKRLMAKCRLLYQENEELGKIISSGRMAKLEGDLALQKSFTEEMKKSQSELDEFLLELDEDVEGMQSTIYYLQQQLREAKEQIAQLQKEKSEHSGLPNGLPPNQCIDKSDKQPSTEETIESLDPPMESSTSDLNGTSEKLIPIVKQEKMDTEESISPSINDCNDSSRTADVTRTSVIEPVQEAIAQNSIINLTVVKTEAVAQSVIVENKNSVSHPKPSPTVERTNLFIDETEVTKSSIDQIPDVDSNSEEQITDTPALNISQKTNKRTSECGRGRKRTRPRTPVELDAKEANLPVRKRTRRREAEEKAIEENKRASVEIDTDTEVQVAQTLASWASTKQERNEAKSKLEDISLGNGEIKMDRDDK